MKNKKRISLFISSIIILLIITIPYLTYIHKFVDRELLSIDTIFGTISGGHFERVQTYLYLVFAKFVPLLLLFIWFITCKHWWVHAIIIPISMYLFQLVSIINDAGAYVDDVDFIYTIPITVIIMVILYFIRSKMAIYILAVDLKKEMDENMKIPKKIG